MKAKSGAYWRPSRIKKAKVLHRKFSHANPKPSYDIWYFEVDAIPTECSSSTTGIRVVSSWPQSHRQLNQQHATLPANIVRGSAGKWPLTWLMFVRACRDQLDISYSSVLPLYALHKMHWWNQTAYSLTPGQVDCNTKYAESFGNG